ncbi:hypothetical protein AVEN_221014-1 [Araneus ventricosus]|uniref:DDE-1 domain-containing protein n=1 Tax=Araneus ventricosus TaxID=182803 RepID=A0A4Y2M946_ARAVE|nr:hypothetical protein AVEN_221014-1 [Araneus ventricosus]
MMRGKGIPVFGPLIKDKATEYVANLGTPNPALDGAINSKSACKRRQISKSSICISTLAKVWEEDVLPTALKKCFPEANFLEEISAEKQDKTEDEEQVDTENTKKAWKQLVSLAKINEVDEFEQFLHVNANSIAADHPIYQNILVTGLIKMNPKTMMTTKMN